MSLLAALRAAGLEADDSTLARSLYASDASLYRIEPQVVVRPRHEEDVLARSRSRGRPGRR